ncbi:GTPase [Calothrix sp. PCC 7507]|uniref:GTPase n=1 Tax=Calothrix sp. PCC 7507 TaxID=99598 RepID=UPI00029F03E2|nr:GTPase [Calothrix sp. PCC 7507]AFY32862.1 GTP-binding protein HSR1-related protein [Calothrix sp. PCC 7507]
MSLLTYQQINYQFLLLTHMVCADEQIHSEEAKALKELAQQAKMGTHTIEEMEKILSQDENFISVEEVARQLPAGEQSEAMRQIIAIAYIDGYFSPLEREMVNQVAEIWNWSDAEIEKLLKQAQNSGEVKRSINNQDNSELSASSRILQGLDSVLSRALVDNLAKVAPGNIGRKVEQLRQEILLAGPEYDDVIKRCAVIASEDYKYAEKSLKNAYDALKSLAKNIAIATEAIHNKTGTKGQANTAKEVAKQLESTRNMLTAETLKELEGVRESLRAKQRALNHFSIAFMGKTKAGKSTLHAIITGGGWEAIGVGKQRTTRFNRVYEWKNIRIIDTPGIGAPGGKSDEEIAASVIEESDVICYVVTNDSIQETEFKFLELLKEKAKPLIVLLNIKNNLRDNRRLEHFLKDPHKLFVMDTSSGLGGHIERIRRYAKQHYANDYFEIIPLMLLAAQMSREPEHKEHRDKLFKASRIQDFLNSIRVSLVEHGVIRRSQTLLSSTVGAIDKPNKWVTEQLQIYQQLTEVLKSKREKIIKDIQKAKKDNRETLLQKMEAIFQDVFNSIPDFAEEHWEANEIGLKLGWERKLKNIRFEARLKNIFEEYGKQFNQDVQEILEEVGHEIQLMANLNNGSFKFIQQDSNNFRDFLKIGGGILGLVAVILPFFGLPFAIPVGIAAAIVGAASNWMKSKDQKRREAVQKISSSLSSQVQEYKYTTLEKAKEEFGKYSEAVTLNINNYFDELIQGLELISEQLSTVKSKLDSSANYLNRAYAKRIIDWCMDKYEPLNDEVIFKTIGKVQRDFGINIIITTKCDFKIHKSQEILKKVLQEDIVIQSNKSSFSDTKNSLIDDLPDHRL